MLTGLTLVTVTDTVMAKPDLNQKLEPTLPKTGTCETRAHPLARGQGRCHG